MAKVMTLAGSNELGAPSGDRCKCVYNPRTKRAVKHCFVGKSAKNRSGFAFVKGACTPRK